MEHDADASTNQSRYLDAIDWDPEEDDFARELDREISKMRSRMFANAAYESDMGGSTPDQERHHAASVRTSLHDPGPGPGRQRPRASAHEDWEREHSGPGPYARQRNEPSYGQDYDGPRPHPGRVRTRRSMDDVRIAIDSAGTTRPHTPPPPSSSAEAKTEWPANQKSFLLKMKQTAMLHMFLQTGSAMLHRWIHSCLLMPQIVFQGVVSAYIFSSTNADWQIASGLMAVGSTVMASLMRQFRFAETAEQHAIAVQQYKIILNDIQFHLHMRKTEQERAQIMEEISRTMDRIFEMQPEPSFLVVRYFERKFKKPLEKMMYEEYDRLEQMATRAISRLTGGNHMLRSSGQRRRTSERRHGNEIWARAPTVYVRETTESEAVMVGPFTPVPAKRQP